MATNILLQNVESTPGRRNDRRGFIVCPAIHRTRRRGRSRGHRRLPYITPFETSMGASTLEARPSQANDWLTYGKHRRPAVRAFWSTRRTSCAIREIAARPSRSANAEGAENQPKLTTAHSRASSSSRWPWPRPGQLSSTKSTGIMFRNQSKRGWQVTSRDAGRICCLIRFGPIEIQLPRRRLLREARTHRSCCPP
jgi:hypothetical protein